MKIVMLCDLYADRVQYQENLLAKYYAKHGHQVTVLAATFDNAHDYYANRYDRGAPSRTYTDGSVKVIKQPYSLNLLHRLRRFGGVAAILDAEAPDLIFVHDIHLNLPEAVAYRRLHPGCRLVMDYHADYSNSGRNWLSRLILHRVIRRTVLNRARPWIDRIYPVVPTSATFLHEVYGIPLEDLHLLPLGADTDLANAVRASPARNEIRAARGIPSTATVIFTGGKLTPTKRTELLVEAVRRIPTPDLHLLLVGDADRDHQAYRDQLRAATAADPRIHWCGWVDGEDVYRLMAACDFAVFPASQSVLWQQALSMGLPLIAGQARSQDSSYLNRHHNIVPLAESDIRVEVLEREIRALAGDKERLAERQAGALRVAADMLSYDVIVARTLGGQ